MKRYVPWIVLLALLSNRLAAAEKPLPLKTGDAFHAALEARVGLTWSSNPLRSALTKLGDQQQVAILLDRRVDPDQLVDFSVKEVSLEQALELLAKRLKLQMAVVESTVYIGPPYAAQRIAAYAALANERAQQAPPELRRKLASLKALHSEAFSTPRDLLEQWSTEAGLKLDRLDETPHDLWPALRLPQQSAAARAALLLVGFDLTIELSTDGTQARVSPLPEKIPLLERVYPAGATPKQREAQLAKQFPNAEFVVEGSKLRVRASLIDHDYIARLIRGEKVTRTVVSEGSKRYTLTVENKPVGKIVQAIAAEVNLKVEFDAGLETQSEQLVSFSVKEAPLGELLGAVLAKTELRHEIRDGAIFIRAKK